MNKLYEENDIIGIADAIREKGVTGTFTVAEMAQAVLDIPSRGSDPTKPLDPVQVRNETRPLEWPYIPLPSEMNEEIDSAYFLYDASSNYCSIAVEFLGTNVTMTIMKYLDTELVSSTSQEFTGQGTIQQFPVFYKEDDDWDSYNYVVMKLTGNFEEMGINLKHHYKDAYISNISSSSLLEMSCKFESSGFSLRNDDNVRHKKLKYASIVGCNNTNLNSFFENLKSLICLPEIDFPYATDCSNMFNGCLSLISIPLFNTSICTNFSNMFYGCSSLTTIPLLNLASASLTTNMFQECVSLVTIPLINTINVTNMVNMFYNCKSLLYIPSLDTSQVTDMGYMFYGCVSLTKISLTNNQKLKYTTRMFQGCSSLTDVSNLDTHNVTNMSYMFYGCTSLTNVQGLDTHSATNMSNMFHGCDALTDISNIDTSKATDLSSFLYGCNYLQNVSLNINVTSKWSSAFASCFSLREIEINKFQTTSSGVANMFNNCYGLKQIVIKSVSGTLYGSSTMLNNCYRILGTVDSNYNPDGLQDGFIYVPDDKVETFKSNTNWSAVASQIKGISELEEE